MRGARASCVEWSVRWRRRRTGMLDDGRGSLLVSGSAAEFGWLYPRTETAGLRISKQTAGGSSASGGEDT
ncbi:hypothetical protein MTO96_014817 [Rhipicephalus appendiculatus]